MGDKPRGYFDQTRDLTNSLILVAPLLVLYEVGLLVTHLEGLNGVDFVTVLVLHWFGAKGLLVLNGLVLVGIAVAWNVRKGERSLRPEVLPVLAFETVVYALSLGVVINLVLGHLPLGNDRAMGVLPAVVASLGAGVNEELFFRLGLLQGLAWVLGGSRNANKPGNVAVAVVVSSLLFSGAHYLPGGDARALQSFLYRFLAGLLFAAMFLGRGLAVATWTHALYDVYVFVVVPLLR